MSALYRCVLIDCLKDAESTRCTGDHGRQTQLCQAVCAGRKVANKTSLRIILYNDALLSGIFLVLLLSGDYRIDHAYAVIVIVQLEGCAVEMTMEMGFPMGMGIPWDSHGNGNW